MDINKKKALMTFILLIGFCGTIGLIIAGFNNVEIKIKDKAEDIVFAEDIAWWNSSWDYNESKNKTLPFLNNTFEPIENYTHPLEGQIIKWYYSEDEEEPTTPIPAIPEFGSILIPIIIMLVSVGRVRI